MRQYRSWISKWLPGEMFFVLAVALLYAGPFGKAEISLVLTIK